MKIIKYLRLPFEFDPARLRQEVDSIASAQWVQHYQSRHYKGDWTAIPLRSINGANDIQIAPTNNVVYTDTEFLLRSVYLREVLGHFQCPLNAVRLLKLSAGSEILEHRDAALHYEKGELRIHIPVITHPDVEFYLDSERIHLGEAECWYMNFNLPHSIRNNSQVDRVHLVIDAMVNDWVKVIFETPGLLRKDMEEHDEQTRKQIIDSLRALNTETSLRIANEMEGL